jgi:GNAT superfamily N-acetyltransferase
MQTTRHDGIEIRVISATEMIPVRHAVLRPGRPVESAWYSNDGEPETVHFGAYRDGRLLSVASVYRAEMPEHPGVPAIQLRGMATVSEAKGAGLGSALVAAVVEFAQSKRAQILWCNARISAVGFYRKLGFEIMSGEFEIPNIGPHCLMRLKPSALTA